MRLCCAPHSAGPSPPDCASPRQLCQPGCLRSYVLGLSTPACLAAQCLPGGAAQNAAMQLHSIHAACFHAAGTWAHPPVSGLVNTATLSVPASMAAVSGRTPGLSCLPMLPLPLLFAGALGQRPSAPLRPFRPSLMDLTHSPYKTDCPQQGYSPGLRLFQRCTIPGSDFFKSFFAFLFLYAPAAACAAAGGVSPRSICGACRPHPATMYPPTAHLPLQPSAPDGPANQCLRSREPCQSLRLPALQLLLFVGRAFSSICKPVTRQSSIDTYIF